MKKVYFKFHWSFLLLGLILIIFNKGLIFLYYVIFGILHEFGHAYAGNKLGYKLNIINLMPYGASISGNNCALKPKDELLIALAGPLVNLFFIFICFLFIELKFLPMLDLLSIINVNFSYLTFNLLPVFPLDGGRILLAGLTSKMKRQKAFKICNIIGSIITILFFILFFISFFYELNYMMGINAIFLLIGLFNDDKTAYYVNVHNLSLGLDKYKNGALVKTFAFNQNANLFDAYKILDKYNINKILIFDEDNKLVKSLMDFELEKALLSKPLTTTLKEIM